MDISCLSKTILGSRKRASMPLFARPQEIFWTKGSFGRMQANGARGQAAGELLLDFMNAYQRNRFGRKLGADAIEERLTEIALLMRKAYPHCMWDPEEEADRLYTYRLRVQVNGREAPLLFTSRELLTYSRKKRRAAIDHRIHDTLSKLLDE